MYSLMIIVVLTSVNSELHSMQYQMHVSRKSRSNSAPYETGYVFSQLNNDPGTLETFVNGGSGFNSAPIVPNVGKHSDTMTMKYGDAYSLKYSDKTKYDNDSPMGKYSDKHKEKYSEHMAKYNSSPMDKVYSVIPNDQYSNTQLLKYNSATMTDWPLNQQIKLTTPLSSKVTRSANPSTYTAFTEPPMTEHAMDYAIAKSNAEYDSKYLPSKILSDALYERLKSVMHYEPSPETMSDYGHSTSDFHMDDNDIRTSSRIPYENWPYSYPMPYEYENMKVDTEIQKAKDKRFAIDTARKIIPVHEHHEYDVPTSHSQLAHTTPEPTTPDNPINGNQPFFSFVLNDYFQKNDDDPLTFKGMDWGNDFDYQGASTDTDSEAGKRNRRLQTNYHHYPSYPNGDTNGQYNNNHNTIETAKGESATEKGYQKKHEFDKHEKGDDQKSNHLSGYEQKGNNYIGFKDFTDSFANKFGGEDYKKDSKYLLKKDQDKSEKRKGFRRVYHKDEYQEDNEFYDNTNKLAQAEEKGAASVHNGGSHAFIKSNAAAAVGNEANAYNKAGNNQNSDFEKNHSGHGMQKGLDTDFNRYKDVAKKAAQSNHADYVDSFRT